MLFSYQWETGLFAKEGPNLVVEGIHGIKKEKIMRKKIFIKTGLTVGDLKDQLFHVPDKTPVYIADHDHGDFETNSRAFSVALLNQKNAAKTGQKISKEFVINGDYLVIHA